MLKNFILVWVTICSVSVLSAQTTSVQTPAPERTICAPCDEPLPGTALWHYMKGIEELIGVRTNAYLANEHFKRAADMDYAPAIKALADSYYSGHGVDEDKHQALLLYIRASDLGDGAAQFNAGVILLRGYAGHQNFVLAYYYLCLATMNEGLDEMAQDAAIYRDEAGNSLSPDQLQDIYRKLVNNPATKPNKRNLRPALNLSSTLGGQPQETPLTPSSENQVQN
jgi:Sel1 repeat